MVTKKATEKVLFMIDVKFTYVNCAVCFNNKPSHFLTDNVIGSLIKPQCGWFSNHPGNIYLLKNVDFSISKTAQIRHLHNIGGRGIGELSVDAYEIQLKPKALVVPDIFSTPPTQAGASIWRGL